LIQYGIRLIYEWFNQKCGNLTLSGVSVWTVEYGLEESANLMPYLTMRSKNETDSITEMIFLKNVLVKSGGKVEEMFSNSV